MKLPREIGRLTIQGDLDRLKCDWLVTVVCTCGATEKRKVGSLKTAARKGSISACKLCCATAASKERIERMGYAYTGQTIGGIKVGQYCSTRAKYSCECVCGEHLWADSTRLKDAKSTGRATRCRKCYKLELQKGVNSPERRTY